MFNFFKKSKFEVISPAKGKLKDITEVSDEVFSSKTLGQGFAIEPLTGEVYSPVNGIIKAVFPTFHAVGIKAYNGTEILIHIGVDTVNLNGEGFKAFVVQGQKVKAGDLLIKFDLEKIKSKVPSTDVIVVFSTGESCELLKNAQKVDKGETDIININTKE
ncbi:PTS glucose transporter subunit IIA [Clostridium sp. SYSU_GA19001]|uniref:PTS sugar transporter subunit IIA n=1 Tax=Clostridium caldaquaticum TaxID=2940653 RepID=UPI00207789D3|nr:PTS glucose transporter subunit IIA [Clostridium caldaquaticum]MCM8711897.1 PTS glucose transporter subunit IIA [Clostridium caldaquaticum]